MGGCKPLLLEASEYNIMVRTVEGSMFRRVTMARRYAESQGLDDSAFKLGLTYRTLIEKLGKIMEFLVTEPKAQTNCLFGCFGCSEN